MSMQAGSIWGTIMKRGRKISRSRNLALVLWALAIFVTLAVPAVVYATSQRVSDPDTSNSYPFSDDQASTRYNGRVWTDKSVHIGDVELQDSGIRVENTEADGFLVEYSALATTTRVNNTYYTPVDVVFVVDLSASMYSGDSSKMENGMTRLANLMDSLTTSVNSLMGKNEGNRVAVVGYRSADKADILLPLETYGKVEFSTDKKTPIDTKNETLKLKVVADGEEKSTLELGEKNTGTNIQAGIAAGMDILNKTVETDYSYPNGGPTVKRVPSLILMADGYATHSSPAEQWWDNSGNQLEESLGIGKGVFEGHALKAMLTASYMKKQVNNHYNIDSNSEYPMRVYTLGFDLHSYEESGQTDAYDVARATLNPAQYVSSASSNEYGKRIQDDFDKYLTGSTPTTNTGISFRLFSGANATKPTGEDWRGWSEVYAFEPSYRVFESSSNKDVYEQFKDGDPVDLRYDNKPNASGKYGAWVTFDYEGYTLNHPRKDDVTSLNYTDKYYQADSTTDASKAFEDIVNTITTSRPQGPTQVEGDDPVTSGYITYTDPIGDYMEVRDVKTIVFADQSFDRTTDPVESVDTSKGERTRTYTFSGSVDSPAYGTHDLSQIKITVVTDKVNRDGTPSLESRDYLKIEIPASIIPLRTSTITYAADGKTIESNVDNGLMPIRVFYTVGLRAGVLDPEGRVRMDDPATADVAEGVSAEYLAGQSMDGGVAFYSNLFSKGERPTGPDSKTTIGDAFSTFVPADNNPFYYFQEDVPLYMDEGLTERATGIDLVDNQTYYFSIDYVDRTNHVTSTIARQGMLLEQGAIQVDEKGETYIAKGSPRLGNLLDLVNQADKRPNITSTAQHRYFPEYTSDDHRGALKIYHGNNGRVVFPAPEAPVKPGLNLKKVDDSNKPLGDAAFDLYLDSDSNSSFDDKLDTKVASGTSDENGVVEFAFLEGHELAFDKTYFLVETKAPSGHQLMSGAISVVFSINKSGDGNMDADAPVKATITLPDGTSEEKPCSSVDPATHVCTVTITVTNHALPDLPATGGSGTIAGLCAGAALVALGGWAIAGSFGKSRV
ncbi:MAG: SpaA isopeptide-forming pilin-related protein [Collinsella sp.]|nr:SpaA isopeptide-forming pilin-related protein [Collinsella sp.]